MEGSITQLGLSNYLINTKEPAVSFFKHNYKNYSNFARYTKQIPFKNNFDFGNDVTINLHEMARYGDLITNIMVEVDLPDISSTTTTTSKNIGYCNGIGNALLKTVELTIGGNLIDRHTSEWMDVWGQLSIKSGLQSVFFDMIKKYNVNNYVYSNFQNGKIYIPLNFWFCQNSSSNNKPLVLPLATMNNSQIELKINIRKLTELIMVQDNDGSTLSSSDSNNINITNAYLLVDFIVLEEKERLRLQNIPRQFFVITQIQHIETQIAANATDKTISLRELKYPISELIWVLKKDTANSSNQYFNYSDSIGTIRNDPISKTRIVFEGRDRVPELPSDYFRKVEPFKVHDNTPDTFIHCYSVSLNPENFSQPSGVCNFSNLSESQIRFTFNSGITQSVLHIFAINYNILQTSDNGNVWLLHTLSKSVPSTFPPSDWKNYPACKVETDDTEK